MKNFVSVNDVKDVPRLIENARAFKENPFKHRQLGADKRIGLLFLNPSLRTRISTQIAAKNLGMETFVFNLDKEGWALEFADGAVMNGTSVEHIKDAAPVLGAYLDIICIRTFPGLKSREEDYAEHIIQQFVRYCGKPVLSLESATLHPLQSLADIVTIKETFQDERKAKVVLTWAPHIKSIPQCVANSFAEWITRWNEADFTITHPKGYELADQFTRGVQIVYNQDEALKNADYVYVKNWSSYQDYGQVACADSSWMLTLDKLKQTRQAKVMHCLPVRRNLELSDEVLDSSHSLVTLQASNRICAAQAVIAELLKGEN